MHKAETILPPMTDDEVTGLHWLIVESLIEIITSEKPNHENITDNPECICNSDDSKSVACL